MSREREGSEVVRTGWVAFQTCHSTEMVNCKFTETARACVQPSHQPRRHRAFGAIPSTPGFFNNLKHS